MLEATSPAHHVHGVSPLYGPRAAPRMLGASTSTPCLTWSLGMQGVIGVSVHQALGTKTMAQAMQRDGGAGIVVKQFSLWGCVDHLLSVVLTAQPLMRNLM